jgi:hypothetical protein
MGCGEVRRLLGNPSSTRGSDELVALPSIPQTNAGETLLINRVDQACAAAVTRGFIAPGTYPSVWMPSYSAVIAALFQGLTRCEK